LASSKLLNCSQLLPRFEKANEKSFQKTIDHHDTKEASKTQRRKLNDLPFQACSEIEAFKEGYRFRRLLFEPNPNEINAPSKIKKLIFCSGQVYYDLKNERKKLNQKVC
jgi:2-oxoglutarate dehydrogenase complex dehydrogenase (E1) component-like enzyme